MSYEPHLLINYDELEEKRSHIEATAEVGIPGKKDSAKWNAAYKELASVFKYPPCIFKERPERGKISLSLIHPELTSHNAQVRKLLDMLNIEYQIIN